MELKAIDLFSGCGGTTAGLKEAGINVVAAVEIDAVAAKTYKINNPEVKVFVNDICSISKKDFEDYIKESQIMLVACPPCQGFSTIRKNGDDDPRNQLIFEYLRLIRELKPDFLLMENVAGLIRGKGKHYFDQFSRDIQNEYEFTYSIVNAADYGVPQKRKRLVFHGIKKTLAAKYNIKISLPTPLYSAKPTGDKLPWRTASVIMGLPEIEAGEEYHGDMKIYNHAANYLSQTNIQRIKYIREHGGSRTSLPEGLVLTCHKNHKGHTDVYGIIDLDKPAPTITGGCMTFSKGRFGHPTQNRALSAREAARLQTFRDNYRFFGNKGQIAQQIGNAVPVELAKASGEYFYDLWKALME